MVNPINDSPTLSAILSQSVDEDNRFEYVLSASDIDDTELSFSAVLDDNGSVSITDSTLTVIPNLNYNGTIEVDVSVSDGQLLDNNNFTLTVIPVNDAPELSVLDDSEIEEDNTLTYILSADDVDGDLLTYNVSSSLGDISVFDSVVSLTPPDNFNGEIEVNVTVTDGELFDTGSFLVNVLAVNDPPELDPLEDATIDEDTPLSYELSATDPDQRSLIYTASSSNGLVSLDGASLSFLPPENFNGDVIIDVTVSDGELTDTGSTVTVISVNDTPEIVTLDDTSINEDSELIYTLFANDIDGDDLFL